MTAQVYFVYILFFNQFRENTEPCFQFSRDMNEARGQGEGKNRREKKAENIAALQELESKPDVVRMCCVHGVNGAFVSTVTAL